MEALTVLNVCQNSQYQSWIQLNKHVFPVTAVDEPWIFSQRASPDTHPWRYSYRRARIRRMSGWSSRGRRERQRNFTGNLIRDQMEVRRVSLPPSLSWSARTAPQNGNSIRPYQVSSLSADPRTMLVISLRSSVVRISLTLITSTRLGYITYYTYTYILATNVVVAFILETQKPKLAPVSCYVLATEQELAM